MCTFAGHRKFYNADELCDKLVKHIEKLIVEENVSEFLVGNFDGIYARTVKSLKEKYPNIKLNLVASYLTKVITEYQEQYYETYDCILMADIPEKTPKRLRILKCNEYMINNSDFLVCFIEHSRGRAGKIMEYAQKKNQVKILIRQKNQQKTEDSICTECLLNNKFIK